MIFGSKNFPQYLYGGRFSLVAEHKPLTLILGAKRRVQVLAASCLQRWAIQLAAHHSNTESQRTMLMLMLMHCPGCQGKLRFYFAKQEEFTVEKGVC